MGSGHPGSKVKKRVWVLVGVSLLALGEGCSQRRARVGWGLGQEPRLPVLRAVLPYATPGTTYCGSFCPGLFIQRAARASLMEGE